MHKPKKDWDYIDPKDPRRSLDREKKLFTTQWAKRVQEITKAMGAAIGMYGDMKGIAVQSLPEVKVLGLDELQDKE